MINENIKTKDALEEFYQDKRSENIAESTLKTYDMHIRNFIDSNDMWDFTTSLINKDQYQWWIEDLKEDQNKRCNSCYILQKCSGIHILATRTRIL